MNRGAQSDGLDAAAAQELIEHALKLLTDEEVVAAARPAVAAALELARESSLVAGKSGLTITGIEVGTMGDLESDEDGSVVTVFNQQPRTPVDARKKRYPIAYGGTGYTCFMTYPGPPPRYVCIRF